jgi:hypothetical protein
MDKYNRKQYKEPELLKGLYGECETENICNGATKQQIA